VIYGIDVSLNPRRRIILMINQEVLTSKVEKFVTQLKHDRKTQKITYNLTNERDFVYIYIWKGSKSKFSYIINTDNLNIFEISYKGSRAQYYKNRPLATLDNFENIDWSTPKVHPPRKDRKSIVATREIEKEIKGELDDLWGVRDFIGKEI
jgi:hypothetical protein